MTIPPRIPVTRTQIEQVVARFYETVRDDPTLGPIFARHVSDWAPHEAKIVRFWSNALLHERSYDGNPMRVHLHAGDVIPAHFDIWLNAFDTVLEDILPPDLAKSWSALAHRIGRGLRFGLETYQADATAVPHLRP